MIRLNTPMVVLALVSSTSGLSMADEASVRAHLANTQTTSYLQKADTRIELIEPAWP